MDELGLLGNTELVLTNHEDAIQGDCIEGTSMKPSTLPPSSFLNQTLSDHCHMRKFDDTDVKAEWLHPAAWFYRLEWEFRPNEMPLLKVCIPCLLACAYNSTSSVTGHQFNVHMPEDVQSAT
jgi:hypothetical protein